MKKQPEQMPEDQRFHDTYLLLKKYRDVVWGLELSVQQVKRRFQMEVGSSMVERRHGSVLNLSSVAAFSAGPRMCLYYASKEFVRSFSEAVAEEVRSTGVTVTALCPGPTATGFEQAAQMKNSHMFSMFKPASAAAVAEAGFRAAQKGKTLRYCGWPTHTVSIAARLLPRSVCRRFMMKVNG